MAVFGNENCIVFYEQPNFGGKSWTCYGDTPSFLEYQNAASSIIVHGFRSWFIFVEDWYRGKRVLLAPGKYQDYRKSPGNDKAASCRISSGENVLVLYEKEEYGGDAKEIVGSVPGLGSFNDKTSSAQVFGTGRYILYEDNHYQGDHVILEGGDYPSPTHVPGFVPLNDKVSSVKADF